MLSSIKSGAAGCWTLENLAPRVLKRNFDPGFLVEHFIKDMGIALAEARRMNLALPGLALVQQLYIAVQAQGHGRKGTHALVLALEHLSGTRDFRTAPKEKTPGFGIRGIQEVEPPAIPKIPKSRCLVSPEV